MIVRFCVNTIRVAVLTVVAGICASSAALAQIEVIVDDSADFMTFSSAGGTIRGNDFQSYLEDNGFTTAYTGVQLATDGPGEFTFEFLGYDTRPQNRFDVDGSRTNARTSGRPQRNFISDDNPNGTAVNRSASVGGGVVSTSLFGFRTTYRGNAYRDLSSFNSSRVATFVQDSNSLTGLETVIFAFEDSGGSGYDDLVIRATFTPVPEPETALLMIAALTGIGVRLHRSRRRQRHHLA